MELGKTYEYLQIMCEMLCVNMYNHSDDMKLWGYRWLSQCNENLYLYKLYAQWISE